MILNIPNRGSSFQRPMSLNGRTARSSCDDDVSPDSLIQFQVIAAIERISENYLLAVLRALLERFPFVLRGFPADNCSEYINHRVVELLTKLNFEVTQSRPQHTNDNTPAETKNGAIVLVRKHLGYTHIPSRFATRASRR